MRALPLVLLAGCPISSERAAERWDTWVDTHADCEQTSDCVVIFPGCPLGCATTVAAEHEEASLEEARRIVAAYERVGRTCEYDCIAPPDPTCSDEGRCVFVE
ncbi:MAG: hypothetical protein H6737_09515 [Alphaproteobacteria bacterium]|nr:hypothetical protein [Alphaproteobacteria bacterium]